MASHDANQDDTHISLNTSQEETQNGDTQTIATPGGTGPISQTPQDTPSGEFVPPSLLDPGQASLAQTEPSAETMESASLFSSNETPLPEESAITGDGEILPLDEIRPQETPAGISDETLAPETNQSGTPSPEVPAEPSPGEITLLDENLTPDQQSTSESAEPAGTSEENDPLSSSTAQMSQPAQPVQSRRLDRIAVLALCAALVLLLLGSSGLIFDLAYYRPNQVLLSATATANAQATGTVTNEQMQIASFNATGEAQVHATAQVYQNLYQNDTRGTPILNDTLNHQSNTGWDETSDTGQDFCGFKNGSYHDEEIAIHFFNPCGEDGRGFANFALQIDMTIVSGDYGGIMFRGHDGFFYYFAINLDGDYSFYLYNYKKSILAQQLDSGSTGYMQSSNSAANEITLIAQGSTFYIYVNQHFIESITDSSYQSGWFGLIADSYQNATDVAFNNLKIWQL